MIKNRQKGIPRFANINFIGLCNARCFFCIGEEANDKNNKEFKTHFSNFKNLEQFLSDCKANNINKIYFTGLDSEPTLYPYLEEFAEYLKLKGFSVGLRTNGLKIINYEIFNDEVSVSIHNLNEEINKLIGIKTLDFSKIKEALKNVNHRYGLVVNRYNVNDILNTLNVLTTDDNVQYIQLRQICTDEMDEKFKKDHIAFDKICNIIEEKYEKINEFDGCPIYLVNNKKVCLWKPMSNETNSWNYFIDGKISKNYFVIEGYNEII